MNKEKRKRLVPLSDWVPKIMKYFPKSEISKTCYITLKNHSQSHCYCVNQNRNEKQRLKNKLEKLKYYCYGREQYNIIQVNRYIYIYIYIYRYIREGGREKPNGVWCNNLVTVSHES